MNLPNIKTSFNFLKSLITLDEYINFALKNDFKSVFLSDELYLYGACDFFSKAKKAKLKPFIGVSLSFIDGEILIYAKNKCGFLQCSKISSAFQAIANYNKQKVSSNLKIILDNANECFCIFIPYNKEAFDFFNTNIQKNNMVYYFGVNNINLNLITNFSDNYVWANDINYFKPEDKISYRALRAIEKNVSYEEIKIKNDNHYYLSADLENKININIHQRNIKKIEAYTEFELFVEEENNFVNIENLNLENFFRDRAVIKIEQLVLDNQIKKEDVNKYLSRIDYEISVISKLNFLDYFYVVADFIEFATKNKILIGPGRGSAAGSLLSFCLDITNVDPIKYDLLFERFLNKDRITKPDIDIDVQDDKRDDVINYLNNKYGDDFFANIVTFQNIGIRQALRDCARIFPQQKNMIEFFITKSKATEYKQFISNLKNIKEWESFQKENKLIINIIEKIVGLPRQTSTHASGVVFSSKKLINLIPVKKNLGSILQTQVTMDYIENFGLIKMDILGLKNLTILNEIIEKENVLRSDLSKIPLNNKETYEIFKLKDTEGIFQFESSGIKNVLKQIRPESIQEIADASALFRPGPQKYIETYIANKKNQKNIRFIDEQLRAILLPTYNVMVYQEQLMKILQTFANFSLNEADIIRRAISKKDSSAIGKYKDKFFSEGLEKKYSQEDIANVWDMILEFADYGFNKSHAISYALISYWLAYYKANKPGLFYTAQLNHLSPTDEKYQKYIYEIKNKNLKFNKPNITSLTSTFTYADGKITLPLSAIKGISKSFAERASMIKVENSSILSFIAELKDLNIDPKNLRSMFAVGYFDIFGYSRRQLLFMSKQLLILAKLDTYFELEIITDMVDKPGYISVLEEESLGFTLTTDVFHAFREKNKTINSINFLENGGGISATIFAKIKSIKEIKTKQGELMAFVNIFDGTGSMEFTIFPNDYKVCNQKIIVNTFVVINIKKSIYKDEEKYVLASNNIKDVIIEAKE